MGLPEWIQDIPIWGYILIGLVFVLGQQHQAAQKRLARWEERLSEDIDEIVEWLKEIDPRMEEERELLSEAWESVEKDTVSFAPVLHMDLEKEKEEKGERTYMDPLRRKYRWKLEEEWKAKRGK